MELHSSWGDTEQTSYQINDTIIGSNKGCEEPSNRLKGSVCERLRLGWSILDKVLENSLLKELAFEQGSECLNVQNMKEEVPGRWPSNRYKDPARKISSSQTMAAERVAEVGGCPEVWGPGCGKSCSPWNGAR